MTAILLDLDRWDAAPDAEQEAAIDDVARRLGDGFERLPSQGQPREGKVVHDEPCPTCKGTGTRSNPDPFDVHADTHCHSCWGLKKRVERPTVVRRFGAFRERAAGVELRLVPGLLDVAPFLIARTPASAGVAPGGLRIARREDLEYAVHRHAVAGEATRKGGTFLAADVPGIAPLQEAVWAAAGRAHVAPERVLDQLRADGAIAKTGFGTALTPGAVHWMSFASSRALVTGWSGSRPVEHHAWTWDPETGWGRLGGAGPAPEPAGGEGVRSPDGRAVARIVGDRVRLEVEGTRDVAAALGEGSHELPVSHRSFRDFHLVFSPDGRFLAVAHTTAVVGVYDVRRGTFDDCVLEPQSARWPVAFSPDGRLFAAAAGVDGGSALIWRLPPA